MVNLFHIKGSTRGHLSRGLLFFLVFLLGAGMAWFCLPETRRSAATQEILDLRTLEDVILALDRSALSRIQLELRGDTNYAPADCPAESATALLDALEGRYVPVSYNDPGRMGGSANRLTISLFGLDDLPVGRFTFLYGEFLLIQNGIFYQKADGSMAELVQSSLDAVIRPQPSLADAPACTLALDRETIGSILLQDLGDGGGSGTGAPVSCPVEQIQPLITTINGAYIPCGFDFDLEQAGNGLFSVRLLDHQGKLLQVLIYTYSDLLQHASYHYRHSSSVPIAPLLREILGS